MSVESQSEILGLPQGKPGAVIVGLDLDLIYNAPYRPRVLIVDDEIDTVNLLKEVLRLTGYDVTGATSCGESLKKCADWNPDLILLDLMMPYIDGWDTYERLRQVTDAPVIIVSALSNRDVVVKGLRVGAEDYITKPFSNAEVVARLQNILRRTGTRQPVKKLYFPEVQLEIDLQTREVIVNRQTIQLSSREFAILELLARQAPAMVSYETIAQKVWGEDTPEVRKRIKYLIYLLRRKLEVDPSNPKLIINSERIGYKLFTEVRTNE